MVNVIFLERYLHLFILVKVLVQGSFCFISIECLATENEEVIYKSQLYFTLLILENCVSVCCFKIKIFFRQVHPGKKKCLPPQKQLYWVLKLTQLVAELARSYSYILMLYIAY